MSEVNLEFIERYQKALKKDANSRVFAPLVEAYRKLGMLNEALPLAQKGVDSNPNFSSGRVALGRVLTDLGKIDEALKEFKKAADISPDNILAHTCLGKTYLRLRKPKQALSSYKIVLFLNPNDNEAKKVIEKLESLTADEYEDDIFARIDLKKVDLREKSSDDSGDLAQQSQEDSFSKDQFSPTKTIPPGSDKTKTAGPINHEENPEVDRAKMRALSLVDALIIRNEIEKATNLLLQTKKNFGHCREIDHRMKMIQDRIDDSEEEPDTIRPISFSQLAHEQKIEKLERLLKTVAAHKKPASTKKSTPLG